MKILRIIARLNVGGPARHVVWLTSALQDEEFRSKLIAGTVPAGERDMAYVADAAGVQPVYVEEMSRELSLSDVVSLFKVYREIALEKPDIVHTHTAKAGAVGRTAAMLYARTHRHHRPKVVHTFHGHVFHGYYGRLKSRIFLAIERLLARLATDKIVVISPQQFREIHQDFGVGRSDQFEIIPLGIDLEPFATSADRRPGFRDEAGAGDDDILIGFVGRLTEVKNVSMLLKSAAAYSQNWRADGGPKLRFSIVGDGRLRPALEAEAAALEIDEIVTFYGNRPDPENVYAGVDIVALTSLNEGTPLSLIEAMASGRAVVSTLVGGVHDLLGEVVERSLDGFQIHQRGVSAEDDPNAFASALARMARDEELRERLAAAGRSYVEANYSKERLVNDIKTMYRNLIR